MPALVHTRTFELWADDRMYPEIEAKKNWTRKTKQLVYIVDGDSDLYLSHEASVELGCVKRR